MKQDLIIVSADDIILYQPTILNLYDFLSESFNVTIVSFEPEYLGNKKETERNIIYLKLPSFRRKAARIAELGINKLFKVIDANFFRCSSRMAFVRRLKYNVLKKAIQKFNDDVFISVDPMPLYAVQKVKGKSHFLSLEIIPGDPYFKKINNGLISSVVIQNKLRYDFLFPKADVPVFYIQNAPRCKNKVAYADTREGLLWAGTMVKDFGVMHCFEFIKAFPDYRFYFKGGVVENTRRMIEKKYAALLANGRTVIDNGYLPAEDYIRFLAAFRIGFCFYDRDLVKKNFNYETAPSGKVFMYLAAGLPVIAIRIKGFQFLEDARAGVLIDDYEPATIEQAIRVIEANYESFSQNSYKTFDEYCFEKNAVSFRNLLLN